MFADVRPAFAGHEICDSSSWLNSVDWFDLGTSYHPTAAGQADGYLPVSRQRGQVYHAPSRAGRAVTRPRYGA